MAIRFNVDRPHDIAFLFRGRTPGAIPRSWAYGSKQAEAAGFKAAGEYPDMLPDEKDWKEIIADCHAKQTFPMYHRTASRLPQKPSQGSLGHCWNYGMTHSVEDRFLVQYGECPKLAPNSLAWLVDWRNKGFFLNETVEGAMIRGIAEAEFCPEYELNPKKFKAGWEENALKRRIAKDGIWDVDTGSGVKKLIAQCLSILKTGSPLYIAHNWWGHALEITGLRWDEKAPNNIVWVHFNSHKDGEIELIGEKGSPDEAYGIGSLTLTN